MRVWDIHPGYLSRQNLLGQHAEIHALFSIITGGKKGYAAHPETMRWKNNLHRLKRAHDLTVLEMKLRGFNHASPCPSGGNCPVNTGASPGPDYVDTPVEQIHILGRKYREKGQAGRIPLPKNGFQFWAHHKYSVMARGYNHYKDIQAHMRLQEKYPLEGAGPLIGQVSRVMENDIPCPALANTVDHLWGYFKREASEAEKAVYLNRQPSSLTELLLFLFGLAQKYGCSYLLHSTIFADFTALSGPPTRLF